MKDSVLISGISATLLLLYGCATVKIYSDAALTEETGLRCYTMKPYLLVEYKSGNDNTVSTSVVFLPDLSSPQYMKLKPGTGASEVKMTFTNSALASYGVTTDSQLPESMAAFADILSKSAYATQTFTGPRPGGSDRDEPGMPFRLYEILITPGGTTLKEVEP